MRARRVDANHAAVVAALRKIGCRVLDLSKVGGGCPDLLVRLGFRLRLIEVKNPDARGKVSKGQGEFHAAWHGHVSVVETPEQAIRVMTA